jgi:hypothetical protein
MKKAIPLTASQTVGVTSPEHQHFLASLNRQIEKTLASGKIKIRPHVKHQVAPAERKPEPAPAPTPAPVSKAPPQRSGPPPRPAFKRPTALAK